MLFYVLAGLSKTAMESDACGDVVRDRLLDVERELAYLLLRPERVQFDK